MTRSIPVIVHDVTRARIHSTASVILWSGLVAAVLDGADAVIFNGAIRGTSAMRIFQFIASGILGLKSFRGGWNTASIGVLIHLGIAMAAALAFYGFSRAIPALRSRPLLWGPVFGIAFFAVMHYVVVPLSAVPRQPPTPGPDFVNLVFSHIFFVGLPIALITSKGSQTRE